MNSFTTTAQADLPHRVILSISSDIGVALAHAWLDQGLAVSGTYRTWSGALDALRAKGAVLVQCDLGDPRSVDTAVGKLRTGDALWDVLVVAPGTQEPVGLFMKCAFDEWSHSLEVNFTAPLRAVHGLLPARRVASERGPMVIFFAGGGTNGAPSNYSAYTVSKIAAIKMVELLDAEIPDTRFSILGPGWVKTKIHESTLKAGPERAGTNYQRTVRTLAGKDCVPMARVIGCCDWLVGAPRDAIGGRNISLVYDPWDDPALLEVLAGDSNMYKLRRHGNERLLKSERAMSSPPSAGEVLSALVVALPALPERHAVTDPVYQAFAKSARRAAVPMFGPEAKGSQSFGAFGDIDFPYFKLGAIDTLDLFGLDELIIFSFYWRNRSGYKRVADIGANVGLHSLLLSRCGYEVRSYEPDPTHISLLRQTLSSNHATNVEVVAAAVSDHRGEAEFVRVLGNTTGSHLAGSKANPYGELERFQVPVVPVCEVMAWADFMKIDAEGHEATILHSTTRAEWEKTDAMLEIGSEANARAIFDHCTRLGVNIFVQKLGWARARAPEELPFSYKEGSAFISCKPYVPGFFPAA